MRIVWKNYFDDEAKYTRAMDLAREVDPQAIFSSSPFHLRYHERPS